MIAKPAGGGTGTGTATAMGQSDGDAITTEAFRSEVEHWATRIGVTPTTIQLRPMRRKWASCSSQGRLTFDRTLLCQPAAFRREVIVHELLHLKVPNHGALFQALLRAHLEQAVN